MKIMGEILIDMGKASKRTKGSNTGILREGGSPPFNYFAT